ncbi:unnamed protein product, partial [Meganyctiphanes norvegica]
MKELKAQKLLQKIRARSGSPPPVHYPTNRYISSFYVADNSHLALSPKYLTIKALSGRSFGHDAPLCLQKAQSVYSPMMVRTRSAYEKERNCQTRLSYSSIDPTYHEMFVPMYIRDPPCLRKSRIINRSSTQYNEQFMNDYNDDSSGDEDAFDEPYGSLHNRHRVHNHVIGSAMKIPDCIRRSPYKQFFIHHPDTGSKLSIPKSYFKDDPHKKRSSSLPRASSGSTNVMNTKWTSGPSYSKEMSNLSSYGAFPKFESYVVRDVPGQPPEMLTYSYDVPKMP